MEYKEKIMEMLDKADHDQIYTIFSFIVAFLKLK
jgi:hypothetical protein|nr:MAG TPA_asm: hypothetical protein [Caudoviricetes sp.]